VEVTGEFGSRWWEEKIMKEVDYRKDGGDGECRNG
jgi:hypothetical protein